MEVLLLIVMGLANVACFVTGAKVGQATANGEKVQMPTINPMQAVRDQRAKREAEIEQGRMDKILQNIEAYDGTSRGQQDVPGR